jgi:hypothetical protein
VRSDEPGAPGDQYPFHRSPPRFRICFSILQIARSSRQVGVRGRDIPFLYTFLSATHSMSIFSDSPSAI